MAQFDVFVNPGRRRDDVPYVVVLQNVRFDRSEGRFVAPLVSRRNVRDAPEYLAPQFMVGGQEVVLDVFNLATLPVERLGRHWVFGG
jgi:toxin CcdB